MHRSQPGVRRTFDRRRDMMAWRDRTMSTRALPIQPPQAWNTPVAAAVGNSTKVLRVLVIDNDTRAADFLQMLLQTGGYSETRVAYTAHAGLAIAEHFRPEVVLVDLDVRDIASYHLGQTLRRDTQLERVRLIAVAESRAPRGRDVVRDEGFESCLLKPITAPALAACLSEDANARL